jgi:hypothetical protein
MTKKEKKEEDLRLTKENLLRLLKPTTQVYAIVKRVAASGMSRRITILVSTGTEIRNISGYVSTLLGLRWNDDGSVTIRGAGMDMGFHIVYSMSRVLWPEGFDCPGELCRSNDHSNGDRSYEPHRHGDGGYALIHRSL